MIDYVEAIDELVAAFNAKWQADTTAVVGYVPEIRWQGVEEPDIPTTGVYWGRFSTQVTSEVQPTHRSPTEDKMLRRIEGLVFVQLFLPRDLADSMEKGRQLATIARDVFKVRTSQGNICFQNARIQDNIPPEQKWWRLNVVAEYQHDYDE